MNKLEIIKRLYKSYTHRYMKTIIISFVFSLLLAGSTSSVAYLLDPAIKKLFIEQNFNEVVKKNGKSDSPFISVSFQAKFMILTHFFHEILK